MPLCEEPTKSRRGPSIQTLVESGVIVPSKGERTMPSGRMEGELLPTYEGWLVPKGEH
jgi:hypothetical protein